MSASSSGANSRIIDLTGDQVTVKVSHREIPFLDLGALHGDIEEETIEAWRAILKDSSFIRGEAVTAFEQELGSYLGVGNVVGVANGTDAITLALLSLGIEKGDEVIAPANTFVATIEAILHAGGTPVLVDVDPDTSTIDPLQIESAITTKTRFILPVHLYGQSADMDPIMEIACAYDLLVVEDNAQALGASYRGLKTGALGHASTMSFYPGKNLGGAGDGGAVATNDDAAADRVRSLANHGQTARYVHEQVGYNSRLDSLQAAFLSIKLRRLDVWNAARQRVARMYGSHLSGVGLDLPSERAPAEHIYHLYVAHHPERDEIGRRLRDVGIATGLHYPTPIHLQEPYRGLADGEGSFPVSERLASQLISLPMGPTITSDEVEWTATAMRQVLGVMDVFASSAI